MRKIKLHKEFFAPDNKLMKPGVHEVPDDWDLPKSTEVLEGDVGVEEPEDEKPVAKKSSK